MSAKPPARRRSNADAGTGPVIEKAPPVALTAVPAQSSVPQAAKPRKFTALLDAATDTRYGRLLDALRASAGPVATRADGNGGTRAGYDLSRADLLRALLEVADDDATVMKAAVKKAQRHYGVTS